jgi:hypothetical protein
MALSPSDEIALSHQFRTLVDSETRPLAGAPLGDLVTGSLRLGRRRRRNRMLAQVAAATAAASVMVAAAVTLPGLLLGGTSAIEPAALSSRTAGSPAAGIGLPTATESSSASGAPTTPVSPAASSGSPSGGLTSDPTPSDPTTSDPTASGATPRQSASPAAVSRTAVENQVIAALRAAGVGGRATTSAVPDSETLIEVNVAGAQGPGMFRISVVRDEPYDPVDAVVRVIPDAPRPALTTAPDGTKQAKLADGTVVRILPDGSTVTIQGIPGNCIQDQVVTVTHPDGRSVYVGNASCLAWDGATNPPAERPLTTEQAVALASDPSLGA